MKIGICLITDERLASFILEASGLLSLGSDCGDDFCFDDLCRGHARVLFENGQFYLQAQNGKLRLNGEELNSLQLRPGLTLQLCGGAHTVVLRVYECGLEGRLSLEGRNLIKLGRSDSAELRMADSSISAEHAKLQRRGNTWWIIDCGSKNGVYLNGLRVREKALEDGDRCNLLEYAFCVKNEMLCLSPGGASIQISEQKVPEPIREEPHFQRSVRIISQLEPCSIELQRPPSRSQKPEINWLPIFLQPLIMVLSSVLIGFLLARNSGNSLYMLMSVPFAVGSVVLAIVNYRGQLKKYKRNEEKRQEIYINYLRERQGELSTARNAWKRQQESIHPSLQECFAIGFQRQRRLFERSPVDEDFLCLRAGLAVLPFEADLRLQSNRSLEMEQDRLENWPEKLLRKYALAKDMPLPIDLRRHRQSALVGRAENTQALLYALLSQAVVHHGFDELRLVCLFPKTEEGRWDELRFLPHLWKDDRSLRYMAATPNEAAAILDDVVDEYKIRLRDAQDKAQLFKPHYLILVADNSLIAGHEFARLINDSNEDLGFSCLYLASELRLAPRQCSQIIQFQSAESAELIARETTQQQKIQFKPEAASSEELGRLGRSLFSIQLDGRIDNAELPNSLSFLEGYGVKTVEELPIWENWQSNQAFRGLAAPLGKLPDGRLFALDAHEKAHGPHGLIAGTTGSGKSELILSWLLSLAVQFHPHDVNFLLIDYKGGGMADLLADLPHTIGSISNLDIDQISRSLISLESEIQRRLSVLRKEGLNHIDQYMQKRYTGADFEAMPHLFIVVDEFGELKRDQPEFMQALVSAARVGRSIGIHLILATQKPSGLVDEQIWSNARFRICLKVQEVSDSREMLHCNDAANLRLPGRAYVQVGHNEVYELIQSFWSGAPLVQPGVSAQDMVECVALLDRKGQRRYRSMKGRKDSMLAVQEIQAITGKMKNLAIENKVSRMPGLWLPELPESLSLGSLLEQDYGKGIWPKGQALSVPVGLYDNPAAQKQGVYSIDFAQMGHFGVYGTPRSGKSSLLKTILTALFRQHAPDELQAYLFDYGAYGLGSMAKFPQVCALLHPGEEDKIEQLANALLGEMKRRKQLFAQQGISSIEDYRRSSSAGMPDLFIVVDQFAAVFETADKLENFFVALSRDGAALGMHLLFTAIGTMGIRYKVLQNVKGALALSLPERGDYSGLVGNIGSRAHQLPAGHGYVAHNPPLSFVAAKPADGDDIEINAFLQEMAQDMAEHYSDEGLNKIKILPDEILLEDIKTAATVDFLPLGLSVEGKDVAGISFAKQHCSMVSCFPGLRAGRAVFNGLLGVLPEKARIVVFDSAEQYKKSEANFEAYFNIESDTAGIPAYLALLETELNARKSMRASIDTFLPIYIFISNLPRFIEVVPEEDRDVLERFIRLGEGTRVFFIVFGEGQALSHWNEIESLVKEICRHTTGCLMGGYGRDHVTFLRKLPMEDRGREWREGYALIIDDEGCTQLKLPTQGVEEYGD